MIHGDDVEQFRSKVAKWLLKPFGVNPSQQSQRSIFWSIPLVSLAPSMVAGFLANFFLETKYLIACDQSLFDPISDVCFHEEGVCCMVISSHTKPITFLASMASTILAAWGVVKGIGLLICSADDHVEIDETEEEEKFKKMLKKVMRESQSVRKIMRETINSAEENETKKPKSEAGRTSFSIDDKEEEDMVQTMDLSEENETKNAESEGGSV